MKRFVSILLFGLLLYNMVGYSVVYWLGGNVALEVQKDEPLSAVQEGDFVTVKVPVSLPYQTDWTAPEPVQGTIQAGNEFYEMVEQIMLNDTLFIKCKPNRDARANFEALSEHIDQHIKNQTTELPKPSKSWAGQWLKEYVSFQRLHVFYVVEWLTDSTPLTTSLSSFLSRTMRVVSPPPELA